MTLNSSTALVSHKSRSKFLLISFPSHPFLSLSFFLFFNLSFFLFLSFSFITYRGLCRCSLRLVFFLFLLFLSLFLEMIYLFLFFCMYLNNHRRNKYIFY